MAVEVQPKGLDPETAQAIRAADTLVADHALEISRRAASTHVSAGLEVANLELNQAPDPWDTEGHLGTGTQRLGNGRVGTMKRSSTVPSVFDIPEVKKVLSGNGHARGKSGENGFSAIISDKPFDEEDRISREDLVESLRILKRGPYQGIKPQIRHERFRSLVDLAKHGRVGKGYKAYVEGLAGTFPQAK